MLDYDIETGIFRWKNPLSTKIKPGQIAGHQRKDGYICIHGYYFGVHTLAWLYVHGELTRVDHIDRNAFNNSFSNFRKATASQNSANRESYGNNSGARGVFFTGKKYKAGIKINGVRIHLGTYKTLEEASNIYKQAAKEFFGEFACEE